MLKRSEKMGLADTPSPPCPNARHANRGRLSPYRHSSKPEPLESDYQHAVVNHAVEYANGNVHTNTMENFWSLLKRGLHGTDISVCVWQLYLAHFGSLISPTLYA